MVNELIDNFIILKVSKVVTDQNVLGLDRVQYGC